MALTVGDGAPAKGLDLVARKTGQLFRTELGFEPPAPIGAPIAAEAAVIAAGEHTKPLIEAEATAPHHAFSCPLRAAAEDVLSNAKPEGWRYVVFRDGRAVVESVVSGPAAGPVVPVSLAARPDLAAELDDLEWLAEQPEAAAGNFEICYLRLPGGLGRVWWLQASSGNHDDDVLLVLPPSVVELRAASRAVWRGDAFRTVVAALAKERLEAGRILFAAATQPAAPLVIADETPCRPAPVPQEPVLEVDDIAGNILLGFNKPFQALLFFDIVDAVAFRRWLLGLRLTSTRELMLVRDELQRQRQQGEIPRARNVWLQVGFSRPGLERLVPEADVAKLEPAFRDGLKQRAVPQLGDPADGEWKMGDGDGEPQVVLIVACDSQTDLNTEIERQKRAATASGATFVHHEIGARLPGGNLEHFGYRDGVSQPAIRGRLSDDPNDVFTPRENADDPNDGKPGQRLVWPGEFVFGYVEQDGNAKQGAIIGDVLPSTDEVSGKDGPDWLRNGSYLVYRRLRQRVREFRAFLRVEAKNQKIKEDYLAALLVGRFPNGAPISRTQTGEPRMAAEAASEDFLFAKASRAISATSHPCQATRETPPAEKDADGMVCPFSAHIRKTYPRDDETRFEGIFGPVPNETHRILRRGIPFGPLAEDAPPEPDGVERGLLFLCYQTSIAEQFEHIQKEWANKTEAMTNASLSKAGIFFSAGVDPIIGQTKETRRFIFYLPTAGEEKKPVEIQGGGPWVEPTGGGYFFVPSLSVVGKIGRGELHP